MTMQFSLQGQVSGANQASRLLNRWAGSLLLIEGLLLFGPVIILGGAINWPASLDEPANVILPLIYEQANPVRLGYFIYLIYSVLFWPVAFLTIRVIAENDTFSPILRLAAGFGLASAILRTLGIIRWLFPMPVLAAIYVDPTTSPQTQETVALVYQVLNDYAGSVGEVLGVSFFAALWLSLVSVKIVQSPTLPRWLGVFGWVAAAGLFSSLVEMFGLDLGAFITVTVSLVQLWFIAMGVALLVGQANSHRKFESKK